LENLKRGYNFGNLGIGKSITLKLNLKKLDVRVWAGFIWLR
jgi:hypothetical protein